MFYRLTSHVLWFFAAFIALMGNASADERWYDVELLVFKHAKAEHFLTEQWPTSWSIPDIRESVNPVDIQAKYINSFKKISKEQQSFAEIIDSLEKSSRYEILAYRNWRQEGLDKDNALNVRIQGGKTYRKTSTPFISTGFSSATALTPEEQQPETGTLFEPVLDENGSVVSYVIPQYTPATQAGNTGEIIHELDGNIKIVLSRFLHIYTDLLLLEPVNLKPERSDAYKEDNLKTDTDLVEETQDSFAIMETKRNLTPPAYRLSPVTDDSEFTTLHGFNIQSHRRMRSGELHHLDHPLVGIIVKVSPSSE
ncbi:MAG TPA: CsiV family protein [Gammaproteobacteria bacterium]